MTTEEKGSNPRKRTAPKLSGLISAGLIPQASPESLERMPSFGPSLAEPSSDEDHMEITERGTVLIPLGRLRPSPFNARKVRTSERIQDIANSMLADQQREPITVYPGAGEDQGYYLIASGATRHLAAVSIGWRTIEAWIDTRINIDDPLSIVRISHLHNDSATETDLDHAIVARDLQEAGYTQMQVALALGYKTNRQITRLNSYFALPESFFELGKTKADMFSANWAEMFKIAITDIGEDAAYTVLLNALKAESPIRDVKRQIELAKKRLASGGNQRTRSTLKSTFDVTAAGDKVGTMRILQVAANKKRIQLEATVSPDMADRLSDRLQEVLKSFANETENG